MFPQLELSMNPMLMCITFLFALCHFQSFLYDMNLVFHIHKHIRSYMHSINWITPSNRSITFSTIQCLKGAHPYGLLASIIVCKFHRWKIFFPFLGLMHQIHPQHALKELISPLYFPIYFWIVGGKIKGNFVPKPMNNSFQNLEVKLTYLSNTIFLGIPCSLIIYFMNICDISPMESVDLTATK